MHVNSIVSSPVSSRYGVVVEIFKLGGRTLACVHMIDPNTGKLLECPDKARCRNIGHTCPIHSFNDDASSLTVWPSKDVTFYVNEGMIDPDLARKATAPVIRVVRGYRKFTITASADGFIVNKQTITANSHPDLYQYAQEGVQMVEEGVQVIYTALTVTEPDSEAYRAFAAVFEGSALGSI